MKKIIFFLIIISHIQAFSQPKLPIYELLFSGEKDEKNKVSQISNEDFSERTLIQINDKQNPKIFKYILTEQDSKGIVSGNTYIIGKEKIPENFNLFSISNNGFVLYDPQLWKKAQEDEKMEYKVVPKFRQQNIDLTTAIAIPNCDETGSAPYCIDWYYQTWVNGVLVEEEYEFTSCTCHPTTGGNGSSGTLPSQDEDCNQLEQDIKGAPVSIQEGSMLISQTEEKEEIEYSWIFYKQFFGLWGFISHEKGTHTKVNGQWQWESLEHSSVSRYGAFIAGSVECTVNSAISTVGKFFAGMELSYTIQVSFICKGSPFTADLEHKSRAKFSCSQSVGSPISIQPVY